MSIQHIRKQGIVRRLYTTNISCSSNNSIGQLFKMVSKKDFTGKAASILVTAMNTPKELSKAPKTQKEESYGITAPHIYRGQLNGHDTIFDTERDWLKENDNDDSLISFVAPVIYLDNYNYEAYQP